MTTLREVKAVWAKLNEFRNKNSFLGLQAATLTPEDIDKLPEVMTARLELNKKATKLFQEIGKQICTDNGVEWGARPEGMTDDMSISEKAEKKLRAFLDFIASH